MKWHAFLTVVIALSLAGCSAADQTTRQALPTIVLDSGEPTIQTSPAERRGGVVTSGFIVPAHKAQLAFSQSGEIEEVQVAVGDIVETGQALARLAGADQYQAALSIAELEVLTAQQDLDRFQENASLATAQAQLELANALDDLRESEYTRTVRQEGNRASQATIDAARASVILAKDELERAKGEYDSHSGKPEDNPSRALALTKYAAAQRKYDSALRNLNWYTGHPTALQQAQLDGEVALAEAQVEIAQLAWERVEDGPNADQLAVLQARLASAEDQAEAARANLDALTLKAPFAGTVSKIAIARGEWVIPGTPALVLADLEHMRVETTDLSELDVPKIELGMAVTVTIEALNEDLAGHVIEISPLADTLGGDVVYSTTIELDAFPMDLRAGMSAEVLFGSSP
jgi:HlyD family secretion protein